MDIDKKEKEAIKRVGLKLEFVYWLIGASFTLFAFIIAVNPALVKSNIFLSLQLTVSIPLFFSSVYARARVSTTTSQRIVWEHFAFLTFVVAYSLLINVIGILLAELVSVNISLCFWAVNILASISYSFLEIRGKEASFMSRFLKDSLFISIIMLLGILPVLGVY